jgi:phosphopantothenoylcysteine decarboxylase / phosphopantothenate---cysteine ligase
MAPTGRKVALAVCGSIAAYKAPNIARLLVAAGVDVHPYMTEAATKFLGPLTLSSICGNAVMIDLLDHTYSGEVHIDMARSIDAMLVAPATAAFLARLAGGRADDLATVLAMCTRAKIIVAPAMHHGLWLHPATQRNVATLIADGQVSLVGPVEGELASGETGHGRLAAPEDIVQAVLGSFAPSDLSGMRLVVTAGPTVEDLDPVRFLSNRSTGRMGFAIAERARARGADVTLITGPVDLATPAGVRRLHVRSAASMGAALAGALGPDLSGADALVMAAAVADYSPLRVSATKIKKDEGRLSVELEKTPDLLGEIGKKRRGRAPVLVGFALETGSDRELIEYAKRKLSQKKVDLVVANSVADGIGGPDNRAVLVSSGSVQPLASMAKRDLADRILDRVRDLSPVRSPRC